MADSGVGVSQPIFIVFSSSGALAHHVGSPGNMVIKGREGQSRERSLFTKGGYSPGLFIVAKCY